MARCGGGSFGSHNYSHARELGSGPLRRGRSRRESARPGSLLFPVPVSRELIGKHGENQSELRCLACEPMSVVGSIWEESLLFSLFAGISTRELAGGTRNRTGDQFAPDCPHRQFPVTNPERRALSAGFIPSFKGVCASHPNLGDWREPEFWSLYRVRLKPSEPHSVWFGYKKYHLIRSLRDRPFSSFCGQVVAHEAMKTGFHHWPQSVKIDTRGQ